MEAKDLAGEKVRKVSVSMTARQFDRLSIICCKAGESKQEYIKRLINEDAKRRGESSVFMTEDLNRPTKRTLDCNNKLSISVLKYRDMVHKSPFRFGGS
jgi:hypothetical protein